MKIYKASRRKSGSFKFSFWLRSNLLCLTRAHAVSRSDLALTRTQILTARSAANSANLTNSRFFLNLIHAKFNGLQAAVKFELA